MDLALAGRNLMFEGHSTRQKKWNVLSFWRIEPTKLMQNLFARNYRHS